MGLLVELIYWKNRKPKTINLQTIINIGLQVNVMSSFIKSWQQFRSCAYKIQSNLLMWSPWLSNNLVLTATFLFPLAEYFSQIEPWISSHLSLAANFTSSLWWPLNAGLTGQTNRLIPSYCLKSTKEYYHLDTFNKIIFQCIAKYIIIN